MPLKFKMVLQAYYITKHPCYVAVNEKKKILKNKTVLNIFHMRVASYGTTNLTLKLSYFTMEIKKTATINGIKSIRLKWNLTKYLLLSFGRLSIIMTFPQNNSKLVVTAEEVFTQRLGELQTAVSRKRKMPQNAETSRYSQGGRNHSSSSIICHICNKKTLEVYFFDPGNP